MRRLPAVVLLLGVVAVVGCSPAPKPKPAKAPEKFDEMGVSEIVPTIDGGAYVVTFGGLYYVRGDQAVRVKETSSITIPPKVASSTEREQYWQALYQQERAKNRAAKADMAVDRSEPRAGYSLGACRRGGPAQGGGAAARNWGLWDPIRLLLVENQERAAQCPDGASAGPPITS
jgi:hypothetical protein